MMTKMAEVRRYERGKTEGRRTIKKGPRLQTENESVTGQRTQNEKKKQKKREREKAQCATIKREHRHGDMSHMTKWG